MRVRDAVPADAGAIAAIYGHYVRETVVSLEEEPPGADEMARRMAVIRPPHAWLVAEDDDGALLGYAYAAPYHARAAYRWTCETTIYLLADRRGGGIGRALYAPLLARMTRAGFTSAVAAATLPNDETVRFHEAMGFRFAGRVAEVGYKHGGWWDVGYWQRDLAARDDPPAEPQPR